MGKGASWYSRIIILLLALAPGCSAVAANSTMERRAIPQPPAPIDAPRTFAEQVLDLEIPLGTVTPAMRELVHDLEKQAKLRVASHQQPWVPVDVRAALQTFHEILTETGFAVSPDGYVELLSEALTPVTVNGIELTAFKRSRFNIGTRKRWLDDHARDGRVILHVGDCDTLSFLYLSMADAIGLPLSLVERAGDVDVVGHNWVAWQRDSARVDWDALGGEERSGGYPALSRQQALGYVRRLVALTMENRGLHAQAAAQLEQSINQFPVTAALTEYAWLLATSWDQSVRNGARAIQVVERALASDCDYDLLDTAAATYATAGRFDVAVAFQTAAIARFPASKPITRSRFTYRLSLYEHGISFIQARPRRQHEIEACLYTLNKLASNKLDTTHVACLGLSDPLHAGSWSALIEQTLRSASPLVATPVAELPPSCRAPAASAAVP
jgi:hypothetical protein